MPVKKTSKDEILIKSAQVFRENGYFNTSISDLSKACKIYNANFYYHFNDKEHLMEEILKYVHNVFLEKAINIAYEDSIQPKERLDKMLKKLSKLFFGSDGGCLMGNIALETSTANLKFLEVVKQFFYDWINALTYIYQSQFNEQQAKEIAEMTIQDFEGGIMMYKLYGSKHYFEKALDRALNHLK